jgi:feruloyl esterase
MMEAQRFPDDYDGVIAGDPNLYQTHHYVGAHIWIISVLYANPNATIPTGKATLIGKAVDQACDASDGVRDGVLEDPRRCQFDPRTLQCSGADAANCLTKEQVDAVRKLWTGPDQSIHSGYYPGLERGGEGALWRGWISADGPFVNLHGSLGIPFARYFIFNDPNWDFRTFDFNTDPKRIEQKLGGLLDASDPNLQRFRDRGGKLIQYHGYSDPGIPPRVSINYHDRVVRFLAQRRARGGANGFYRLFMVPGMGHCADGPGATSFDMLTAIEQWVERGVAPARIIATKFVDDDPAKGVARTHPLCPFPQVAKYMGTGNTNDAASFVCAEE